MFEFKHVYEGSNSIRLVNDRVSNEFFQIRHSITRVA